MTTLHVLPHTDGWAVFFEGTPKAMIKGCEDNPFTFSTRRGAEKFVVGLGDVLSPPFHVLFHDKRGRIIDRVTKKII